MSKPHSPTTSPPILPSHRRTHRKRISALRLSSDTTSTLPEYIPTGGWSQTTTTTTTTTTSGLGRPGIQAPVPAHFGIHHQGVDTPLDLPPDYPDSAEEADEDTDTESAFEGGHYGRQRSHRQQEEEYVPQFTVYGGHQHNSLTGSSSGTTSPRRVRRFPSHKSGRSTSTGPKASPQQLTKQSARSSPVPSPTTSDLFLDSLLERSVHALEMSNALLQSSMTTRSTLTNLMTAGEGSESSSPSEAPPKATRQRGSRSSSRPVSDERYDALESRIKTWKNVRETWVDDLDEITRGVERLFAGGEGGESVDDTEVEVGPSSQSRRRREHIRGEGHRSEGSITNSLPIESPLNQRTFPPGHQHQRSLSSTSITLRSASPQPMDTDDDFMPQLRFEAQGRDRLVAHPPRALTQYVVANADTDTIILPSTLGVRSTSSSHRVSASDRSEIPAKGAYTMLSSLVSRTPSASSTPSSSTLASPNLGPMKLRRGSSGSSGMGVERPCRGRKSTSPSRSTSSANFRARSHSETPRPVANGRSSFSNGQHNTRRMTPPIEGLSSSSQSSTSTCSSDEETIAPDGQRRKRGPSAKRTVQELRRILDEQPAPRSPQSEPAFEIILRPPALLQKVGGTSHAVEAGTSNATASVSRLFTKNKHSSSTRPPSPPRQSALKGRSTPGTPTTPVAPTSFAIEAAVQAAQVTAAPKSDLSSPTPGSAFRIPQVITTFARNALRVNGKGKAKEGSSNGTLNVPTTTTTTSQPGSGASTPKRISFAELPESYRGGNSRFRSKRNKSAHGRKRSLSDSDERDDDGWFGWLMGGTAASLRHDRMEDRFDRPWGSGPSRMMGGGGGYSSGIDEWGV
ncbi:hypothetical protein AAF712_002674 [Marasmius tenuissimus]|uniref:Uncharacterized protein n=1 Tax=Marasmius tenuissimus TaxID=585030 RepID=A0ABR3A9Z9_9AGAR